MMTYGLVKRVAFDCIPTSRRRLLNALIGGEKSAGAASTLSYAKQELEALALLSDGALSDFACDLMRQANML